MSMNTFETNRVIRLEKHVKELTALVAELSRQVKELSIVTRKGLEKALKP